MDSSATTDCHCHAQARGIGVMMEDVPDSGGMVRRDSSLFNSLSNGEDGKMLSATGPPNVSATSGMNSMATE